MVVPVAAAQNLTSGFARTMRLAMVIGLVCSVGGLVLTAYVDLPPGGVIVLIAVGVYVIGLIAHVATAPLRAHRGRTVIVDN